MFTSILELSIFCPHLITYAPLHSRTYSPSPYLWFVSFYFSSRVSFFVWLLFACCLCITCNGIRVEDNRTCFYLNSAAITPSYTIVTKTLMSNASDLSNTLVSLAFSDKLKQFEIFLIFLCDYCKMGIIYRAANCTASFAGVLRKLEIVLRILS